MTTRPPARGEGAAAATATPRAAASSWSALTPPAGWSAAEPAPAPEALPAAPGWMHSRFVALTATLVALATVLAAWGFVRFARAEFTAQAKAQARLFARVIEDHVARRFDAAQLALDAVAARLEGGSADDAAHAFAPWTTPPSMSTAPAWRSLSLVDAAGRVRASTVATNVGIVLDRARIAPASAQGGLGAWWQVTDLADLAAPRPGTTNGRVSMMTLIRTLPSGQRLVAVVGTDDLLLPLKGILGEATVRSAVVGPDGVMVAGAGGWRRPIGTPLDPDAWLRQRWPSHGEGQIEGPGLDGDAVVAAFEGVARWPLVAWAEVPAASIEARLAPLQRTTLAAGSAALALIGALAWLAWRGLRGQEAARVDLEAARGSIAAQHAFTDRMFQLSPIPIVVKDAEGRFVRVNNAWTDLTGLVPERVIGRTMRSLYPPHLAAPQEEQERHALATGQPCSYEQQMLDGDGLPRDVLVRVTPYAGHDGRIAGLIGCTMDVSEFREAEVRTLQAKAAAERANTAKGEFLANISHELRTPLQSILGFSELGVARAVGDARAQAMFSDIQHAGERMLTLVNNLLDLSRLESTVGDIKLAPQDFAPALLAVRDELQPLADRRRLWLAAPQSPRPLWVDADAFRLQQVVRNLLANAIRFAPEGTTVELNWRTLSDGQQMITVRDRGPGIPADELDSIFGAFVQSSRTKSGAGGSGLGLAICRKIVQAHRGKIRAFNAPDGGAVFEIRLPGVEPGGRA